MVGIKTCIQRATRNAFFDWTIGASPFKLRNQWVSSSTLSSSFISSVSLSAESTTRVLRRPLWSAGSEASCAEAKTNEVGGETVIMRLGGEARTLVDREDDVDGEEDKVDKGEEKETEEAVNA